MIAGPAGGGSAALLETLRQLDGPAPRVERRTRCESCGMRPAVLLVDAGRDVAPFAVCVGCAA